MAKQAIFVHLIVTLLLLLCPASQGNTTLKILPRVVNIDNIDIGSNMQARIWEMLQQGRRAGRRSW